MISFANYLTPATGFALMMKINHRDVEGTHPEDTEGVDFKPLIAQNMNPPTFHMRLFEISPGGHTPRHTHEWEHEVFVLEGEGEIVLGDREIRLVDGDAVYVEPNEQHQFVNDGRGIMRMICVIPKP